MDRIREASSLVKNLNSYKRGEIEDHIFIKNVCNYFDKIKDVDNINPSELRFLKFISNVVGIPHYYDLLSLKFEHKTELTQFNLNTLSSLLYESSLHTSENIKIHKYQKKVLSQFDKNLLNRFFLSASTSFGKTYLIYEIIKKMNYENIVLIFPTIALLSENYQKIMTDDYYSDFKDEYKIHTLSDINELGEKNIFIFTPERYLSFMDKNIKIDIDFSFVDEIYKIDNEYLIEEENRENERDTAYRVALFNLLRFNHDVLLVGPYIKLPNEDSINENQSFNNFLTVNKFVVLDYNNIEIVNKTYNDIYSCTEHIIDEKLTISLKGYSNKKEGQKLSKIVDDILLLNENIIVYSRGPGVAENKAKEIIEHSKKINELNRSEDLEELISHLKNTFRLEDWSVIKSLENKIGIHHGLIPKYIQKEIINLFNNGCLDLLISTTTITEGVNTSAKNLIVTSSSKGTKT